MNHLIEFSLNACELIAIDAKEGEKVFSTHMITRDKTDAFVVPFNGDDQVARWRKVVVYSDAPKFRRTFQRWSDCGEFEI